LTGAFAAAAGALAVTTGVSVIVVSDGTVAEDLGVFVDDSLVAFTAAVDALFTFTVNGTTFSTIFVHDGEGGEAADLVFCTSLQHFEQNPPVAAFPKNPQPLVQRHDSDWLLVAVCD